MSKIVKPGDLWHDASCNVLLFVLEESPIRMRFTRPENMTIMGYDVVLFDSRPGKHGCCVTWQPKGYFEYKKVTRLGP